MPTLKLTRVNLAKVGVAAAALVLVLGIAVLYGSVAIAETNSTELVAISIDGGGGEMNGGSLTMDYVVAEGQPIGTGSSDSYSLESGFIPIIAQQYSLATASPTATPIPTPTPTVTSAPGISGWGLVALATGMLVALRRTLMPQTGN